jgi:hypothetical protein
VAGKEARVLISKDFTEQHQCLALQVLFPKKAERSFEDSSSPAPDAQDLARYGIVNYIDNKTHFIHHTFVEYYVCRFVDKRDDEGNYHYTTITRFFVE